MDIPERFRRKLDDLMVSDYCGLNSPGVTCYLNSVLQVLYMTKDFCDAVERCCKEEASMLDLHLWQLFTDLCTGEAKTHNIIESLGITNVYEQRDAAEYFEKILSQTSLEAAKMFRGELNHTTTCVSCRKRTDCHSFFWSLPLAVKDSRGHSSSVEKGLKAFFEEQKVFGDNQMFCSHCNEKQDAVCQCVMTRAPEVLTLLLKRFSFDSKSGRYVKLHSEVSVPQTLDVKCFQYELYATVNHYGTLKGGHYVAQVKSYENRTWYKFSDKSVVKMRPQLFQDEATSLSCSTAYLLMYRTVTSSASQQGNKHSGRAGFWKIPCACLVGEEAEGSRNWGGPQKAVVAKSKWKSFSREDNACVWESAGRLAENSNQEAACARQHVPPPFERLEEARGDIPERYELQRNSSVPPIGNSDRRPREQSRTRQQDTRCTTHAGTKTRKRSNCPYESPHLVKKH